MKKIFILSVSLCLFMTINAMAFQLWDESPDIHGFIEGDFGLKLNDDITKRDNFNFFEQRLQLGAKYYPEKPKFLSDWNTKLNAKADFLVDWYYTGQTSVDLRELDVAVTPMNIMDIKLGRQVLTWGTGDYLFINDVFPKDYVSFFIGRDDEYLKKPSDALRVSLYPAIANIDFVVMPIFVPDTIPEGERLSFYNPITGILVGDDLRWHLDKPETNIENTELAMRLYRTFSSYEAALYAYRGFYRSPVGVKDPSIMELYYPELDIYGCSLRGPLLTGIANIEFGYYNSREDTDGTNPFVENSAFKVMTGYEKDLGNDLSIGLQYMYEDTLKIEQDRHLVTFRIMKQLFRQTLRLSLFTFCSPSDKDIYLRPVIQYDMTDNWQLTLGANLIWGENIDTEFGQLENNKNVYVRARYSF